MKTIHLLILIVAFPFACQSQTSNDTPPSAKGVWKLVLKEDRQLKKQFHIYQRANQWQAKLGKTNIPIKYQEGKFTLHWKTEGAKFDGKFVSKEKKRIKGFWRQYGYVSPVLLRKTSQGWEGTREVQFKRLTIYLVIRPRKDGVLGGFIYNPERNQGAFINISRVVQKGKQVLVYEQNNKKPMFTGTLAKNGKTLDMLISIHGMKGNTLHKVDPNKEILARPWLGQKTYTYQQPPQLNDGWQTTSLKKKGADMTKIKTLMEKILTQKYLYIHSLLIVQNKQLLLEEYFYGHHRDQYHDTRSAGKSLASTMVGLALDQGLLKNVNTVSAAPVPVGRAFGLKYRLADLLQTISKASSRFTRASSRFTRASS